LDSPEESHKSQEGKCFDDNALFEPFHRSDFLFAQPTPELGFMPSRGGRVSDGRFYEPNKTREFDIGTNRIIPNSIGAPFQVDGRASWTADFQPNLHERTRPSELPFAMAETSFHFQYQDEPQGPFSHEAMFGRHFSQGNTQENRMSFEPQYLKSTQQNITRVSHSSQE
jgi:hypothetical protein